MSAAKDAPPPEFFTGLYQLVGRAGSGQGAVLVDDTVWISAANHRLKLRSCAHGAGFLDFSVWHPELVFLEGSLDEIAMSCEYFVDYANYAFLACQTGSGGLLSFRALQESSRSGFTCPDTAR